MAAGVGVKGADAHQAVNALFAAQIAVGMVAAHLKGNGLEPGLVALQNIQQLHRKAHALTVAGIHAVEHAGPVLRLGAARTGMQGQHRVMVVVLAAHQRFQLQGVGIVAQLFQHFADLRHHGRIVRFLGQLHHHLDVVALGYQPLIMLDLGFQLGNFAGHMGAALQIIPKSRLALLLMQLGQFLLHMVDMQTIAHIVQLGAQGFQIGAVLFKLKNHGLSSIL